MTYRWSWVHADPSRRISDGGDSDSHRLRIGHGAIDIPSYPPPNTECEASVPLPYDVTARVDRVGFLPDCGQSIDYWFIWRDAYWWARTCHWARIDIVHGATFKAGDILGVMGKSGLPITSGIHQHFALRRDNVWVDPEAFLFEQVMEDSMTDEQRAELNRVAEIFAAWAALRRERAALVVARGYGLSDSLDAREADELDGAVGSIRVILAG